MLLHRFIGIFLISTKGVNGHLKRRNLRFAPYSSLLDLESYDNFSNGTVINTTIGIDVKSVSNFAPVQNRSSNGTGTAVDDWSYCTCPIDEIDGSLIYRNRPIPPGWAMSNPSLANITIDRFSPPVSSFLQVTLNGRRVFLKRALNCECQNPWETFNDPANSASCSVNGGVRLCLIKTPSNSTGLSPSEVDAQANDLMSQIDAAFEAGNPPAQPKQVNLTGKNPSASASIEMPLIPASDNSTPLDSTNPQSPVTDTSNPAKSTSPSDSTNPETPVKDTSTSAESSTPLDSSTPTDSTNPESPDKDTSNPAESSNPTESTSHSDSTNPERSVEGTSTSAESPSLSDDSTPTDSPNPERSVEETSTSAESSTPLDGSTPTDSTNPESPVKDTSNPAESPSLSDDSTPTDSPNPETPVKDPSTSADSSTLPDGSTPRDSTNPQSPVKDTSNPAESTSPSDSTNPETPVKDTSTPTESAIPTDSTNPESKVKETSTQTDASTPTDSSTPGSLGGDLPTSEGHAIGSSSTDESNKADQQ